MDHEEKGKKEISLTCRVNSDCLLDVGEEKGRKEGGDWHVRWARERKNENLLDRRECERRKKDLMTEGKKGGGEEGR